MGILHENDKKLPSLVKGILKEVVKKKKKKVKESYINMMSYPHAQDFPTSVYDETREKESKGFFNLS
jgi:hypothetical protein